VRLSGRCQTILRRALVRVQIHFCVTYAMSGRPVSRIVISRLVYQNVVEDILADILVQIDEMCLDSSFDLSQCLLSQLLL